LIGYPEAVSDLWAAQTSMQRATGTAGNPSGPAQADLQQAVTPYSAQLGAQSAKSQLESEAEPAIAGAATKMNNAITDVLHPLSGVLGGALGG
jgi:hypothetical protein